MPVGRRGVRPAGRDTKSDHRRAFDAGTSRVMITLAALLVMLSLPVSTQKGQLGYYRFPALSGDTVVFTAEGDLWRVGASGGIAQRLTTHPEEESRPAISPDGKTVAYSASYEGPVEVYTLPLDGGVPVRRTHDASRATRRRLDAGRRDPLRDAALFDAAQHPAGAPRPEDRRRASLLPLAQASDGAYDAKGSTLFFTRLPFQGSHTRRYKGGTAQNLWKFAGAGRSRAAHRRLRRHQQDADAVERPRLLRQRSRRVDEHLVDGRERPRPEAAHEAPRVRRAVAVALEGPHRLPAGRRPPAARHRQRRRQARADHARLRLRSVARAVGEERHRLGVRPRTSRRTATASSSPRAARCSSRRRSRVASSRRRAIRAFDTATGGSCRTASRC